MFLLLNFFFFSKEITVSTFFLVSDERQTLFKTACRRSHSLDTGLYSHSKCKPLRFVKFCSESILYLPFNRRDNVTKVLTSVFFSVNIFPQAPDYPIRIISIFFKNSRRYSQFAVHHFCCRFREKTFCLNIFPINHRCR